MKEKIAHKVIQLVWLAVIALLSLALRNIFFSGADYSMVFMFTHISITIIFTQLILGISEIVFKRTEPWMDLLKFLIWSFLGFGVTILVTLLISKFFHIPIGYAYIGTVIVSQLFFNPQIKKDKSE